MNTFLKTSLAATVLLAAGHSMAQVTFYQDENYQGGTFTTDKQVENFRRFGFNDKASSVVVASQAWEVCDGPRFAGRCKVLRPGQYPTLASLGLTNRVVSMRGIGRYDRIDEGRFAPIAAAVPANAQVVFYENENFQGQSFSAQSQVDDFNRYGFNDRASSAVVLGDQWEVCENTRFNGRCVVLRPGRYPSLTAMGLNDRASSIRGVPVGTRVSDDRYAPLPLPAYDNRRRNDERLYEVNVTSSRAVMAAAEQRCWMESQAVVAPPPPARTNAANIGGAIAGALIGGILGHQVGGGSGKDIATVGGAVAGAAVGANVAGRFGNSQPQPAAALPDVQRCEPQVAQTRPDYWDVTYTFRGQDHRVQMTTAPGSTLMVNGQGEPRA